MPNAYFCIKGERSEPHIWKSIVTINTDNTDSE